MNGQMESEHGTSPKKGFVKIRPDHIRRVGITRVHVGGLFGEKKARKNDGHE